MAKDGRRMCLNKYYRELQKIKLAENYLWNFKTVQLVVLNICAEKNFQVSMQIMMVNFF